VMELVRMGSRLPGGIREECCVEYMTWYPALAMSFRHPLKKRNKKEMVEHALNRSAEECDEPVTVVCSRYERERKPLSLIRTCQELVAGIPTPRKSV
jgi:hypothetical protein